MTSSEKYVGLHVSTNMFRILPGTSNSTTQTKQKKESTHESNPSNEELAWELLEQRPLITMNALRGALLNEQEKREGAAYQPLATTGGDGRTDPELGPQQQPPQPMIYNLDGRPTTGSAPAPVGTVNGGATIVSGVTSASGNTSNGGSVNYASATAMSVGYNSSNFVNSGAASATAASFVTDSNYSAVNIDERTDGTEPPVPPPHICCKVCCDCRRACLVLNLISIGLQIFAMIFVTVGATFFSQDLQEIEQELDDNEVIEEIDSFLDAGGIKILEMAFDFISIISIGLHACGVYGAIYFKPWGIIVAGSAYGLKCVLAVLSLDLGTLLQSGFFFYPHYIFVEEMKQGIMNEYNYHKIAFCCGNKEM